MQHHMYVQLNLWYRIGLILGGKTTTMDVHGLYPRAITAQDLSPVRGGHDMSAIDHRLLRFRVSLLCSLQKGCICWEEGGGGGGVMEDLVVLV